MKKIGKIPPGGGWKTRGRRYAGENTKKRRVGDTFLHVAVDDHSRVVYVEAHDDERADTLVKLFERAHEWFRTKGMMIDE